MAKKHKQDVKPEPVKSAPLPIVEEKPVAFVSAPPVAEPKSNPPAARLVLRVASKSQAGRWRAGRFFTLVATIVDPATCTPAELAAIEGDPELRVELVEV